MFKSILIANRGEIACRVMKTASKMGIRTIAVFSDADRSALHVKQADEAVYLGGSAPSGSYLDIEKVVAAAKKSGAEAVHPGYGFLSENTKFAQALEDAGIAFIGPAASCIASMGDKIESKQLAEKAGVPGVPGYSGDDQSDATLISEAEKIGFPVMVKASAGGGGKGMRRVFERAELEEAIQLARKEALSSFGDDRLLVEKLITRPRHLEVQIAGDKKGNVVHLFERDCSVQRNNQKVLEEAPAPNLPDAVREKLFERAIKLAEAINYDSLGTVEFIMDADDDEPAFLEMNTRLQVEHPVTELVTGLDLVELQIRIAAGEAIPFSQSDVTVTGHAIEARVTAEKPAQNFLPDIGPLAHISWPENIRIDTGVETGSEISQFYDSMIAKVISYGPNRYEACDRLLKGLSDTAIMGVETNVTFLSDCVKQPSFYEGKATTSFLGEVFPDGWVAPAEGTEEASMLAASLWAYKERQTASGHGFRTLTNAGGAAKSYLTVLSGENEPLSVIVEDTALGNEVSIDGKSFSFENFRLGNNALNVEVDGHRKNYQIHIEGNALYVAANAQVHRFEIMTTVDHARMLAQSGGNSGDLKSEMPGSIAEVKVKAGDQVSQGDALVVMESMKLLITMNAPVSGVVKEVNVNAGDLVNAGDTIVIVEAAE